MVKHGVTEFLQIFESIGRQFFDLETDLLIVLDETGAIERVNPAFERITGYAESDVLRVPIIKIIDNRDWSKFLNSFSVKNPEPFRVLKKNSGTVEVRLIPPFLFKRRFDLREGETEMREDEVKRQGFLVLRKV